MGIFTSKHIGVAVEEVGRAIATLGREEQRQRVEQLLDMVNKLNGQNGVEERFSLFPHYEPPKCKQCGGPLGYSRSRGHKKEFCSDKCRVAHHRQAVSQSASQEVS